MINKDTLKSFVDGMAQAADVVKRENPDYLIAPMAGSIPFIDAMVLVDRDFDPSKVVYMPASSRIADVNNVILRWYSGFLNESVHLPETFPKVMGIDEVVSGQSVLRCFRMIDQAVRGKLGSIKQDLMTRVHSHDHPVYSEALTQIDSLTDNKQSLKIGDIRDRAEKGFYLENHEELIRDSDFLVDLVKNELRGKLVYKTIGIEDSKKPGRVPNYVALREAGRVIPVPVKQIITMDRPNFVPVVFKQLGADPASNPTMNPYLRFTPFVEGFSVTPDYLNFLRSVANYVGADPEKVGPVNMTAILDSSKYFRSPQAA